jgi:hypothetical protein
MKEREGMRDIGKDRKNTEIISERERREGKIG